MYSLIWMIGDISVGIALIAPFLTTLLLSRRIERISGVRSYWHLFLSAITFYVIYLSISWVYILGIITIDPLVSLFYGTTLLMLSALSVALSMMGLMSTIDYPVKRIFLIFTSVGVAIPIILGLSLTYFTAPLLPLFITILTLLQGFLMWCYLSFSYFLLWRLRSILERPRLYLALIASIVAVITGLFFFKRF